MKDIKGYEGLYAITEDGRVWSYKRQKFLSPGGRKGWYQNIRLCKNGDHRAFLVHRLVAETFIPNPENLPNVNHIDEDKTNNSIANLEWCNQGYNNQYNGRALRVGEKTAKSNRKLIRCIELDKVFNGLEEAAKEMNLAKSTLGWAATGRSKTAGGYHWQYESKTK